MQSSFKDSTNEGSVTMNGQCFRRSIKRSRTVSHSLKDSNGMTWYAASITGNRYILTKTYSWWSWARIPLEYSLTVYTIILAFLCFLEEINRFKLSRPTGWKFVTGGRPIYHCRHTPTFRSIPISLIHIQNEIL